MKGFTLAAVLTAATFGAAAAPASAAVWAEQGDAGQTRATAQEPTVSPLTEITGAVGSDPDLYRLTLPGGNVSMGNFTATTQTGSDPILTLFRADGSVVTQNDDFGSLESCITANVTAGTYYLGITRYSNFPQHADAMGTNPGGFGYRILINQPAPCRPMVVDSDADGIADNADNCPAAANPGQADLDGDRIGDACDGDIDGDGAANGDDVFPRDAGEQRDSDGDGVGDNADAFPDDAAESVDTDADGVGDNADNCGTDANADQADLDGDGQGDACDGDVDGDEVANDDDAFPRDPLESSDRDGDGIGDNADRFPDDPNESADADDDGVGDGADNCRTDANTDQADLDGDGQGDACDADVDGDGIANGVDNAPRVPNADQADLDRDGIGDVIDATVLPLSADMCKREGYKRFYDGAARFRNQGDCVSFVATGGRNLPAG